MKVLFPIDGSESSLRTIQAASRLLDKQTTQAYLLTILVPMAAELPTALFEPGEEEAESILKNAQQQAESVGLKVVEKEYRTFREPASAICDYADEKQVNLIVIGSHGYQGIAKFLMGSVSERVFKHAKQPVIVIRNDKTETMEISHFEKTGMKKLP